MSSFATSDIAVSRLFLYRRSGTGAVRLGLYGSDPRGDPGILLAQSDTIPLKAAGEGWIEAVLDRSVHLGAGSRFWIAWLVDGNVDLSVDTAGNEGSLGGSEIHLLPSIRSSPEGLPGVFPASAQRERLIAMAYALGRTMGAGGLR